MAWPQRFTDYRRRVPPTTYDDVVDALRTAGCVYAEDEADLIMAAAQTHEQLAELVRARTQGLPLEQVVGWAEFCGRRIVVRPGVFVPRRRTEWLAAQAIALARSITGPVVLDLCCGAGALAAAVSAAVDAEVHACDIEPAAVACARLNLSGPVYEGDLFEPLPRDLLGRVDVLVANVPYVPTDEIDLLPTEARVHEPRVTLDGGLDGLEVARRIAVEAPEWLAPGGSLLIETSDRQVATARQVFEAAGLSVQVAVSDDLGATVVIGVKRPELERLVDRVPEGWTVVLYDGRRYGLTRTTRAAGRSVSLLAEELGGTDVVSANVYRTSDGDALKPCEMPEEKVLAFLRGWEPR